MMLQVPDTIVAQSGCGPEELLGGLAIGLFVEGRLTLGQAGQMLGLSKDRFLQLLGERGIPMPYDEADLEGDLQTLNKLFPPQPRRPA